jgi:hypothetical protein
MYAVANVDTGSLNAMTLGPNGDIWYTQRSENDLDWLETP